MHKITNRVNFSKRFPRNTIRTFGPIFSKLYDSEKPEKQVARGSFINHICSKSNFTVEKTMRKISMNEGAMCKLLCAFFGGLEISREDWVGRSLLVRSQREEDEEKKWRGRRRSAGDEARGQRAFGVQYAKRKDLVRRVKWRLVGNKKRAQGEYGNRDGQTRSHE